MLTQLISGYRLSIPKHAPEPISELMQACWRSDVEQRPTFLDIKEKLENYYGFNVCKGNDTETSPQDDPNTITLKYLNLRLHELQMRSQYNAILASNSR